MNKDLLNNARGIAQMLGCRIIMCIPSILAQGEEFTLRLSMCGPDAMPLDNFPNRLIFGNSQGVEGLPESFAFAANEPGAEITGLKAVGPGPVVIRAKVTDTVHLDGDPEVASNPGWVSDNPSYRLFWGDIHVHTTYSNCNTWRCSDPEFCYQYAREVSFLDFAAAADHLRGIVSDKLRWPRLQELAREYNDPGRFVSMLGFESSHAQGYGGDNNVYFLDDDAPYFWVERDDMHGISPKVHLKELWEQMDGTGKPYFTAPHHTGRAGKYRHWDEDYYNAKREPLFEIFSGWGSSEMRYSRFPISGGNNDAKSYYVDALKAGTRFGVIGSSDCHQTLPGGEANHRGEAFQLGTLNGFGHKGLAAVRVPELSRKALFNSMMNRDCYATTFARSLVDMKIGDASMGQEIPADDSLKKKRDIRVRFTLESTPLASVTLMRNGEELETKTMRGGEVSSEVNELVFEDNDNLEDISIRDSKFHPEPFAVYYTRIRDSKDAHQWTSPIWIDA